MTSNPTPGTLAHSRAPGRRKRRPSGSPSATADVVPRPLTSNRLSPVPRSARALQG